MPRRPATQFEMPVRDTILKLLGKAVQRRDGGADARALVLRVVSRVVTIAHPTNASGNNRSTR